MKDPRKKIEEFCCRHPNFGIPGLMRYVVIANAAFWLLGAINKPLMFYLMFNPALILRGQVWRLISFVFIPPTTGILAFIAMYFYYWIGTTLEREWGTGQFTIYFFTGVILTILYGFAVYFIFHINAIVSAEFIYLSLFFTFATLYPDMQVLLFFIIPVKVTWLGLLDVAYLIYEFIGASSATRFAIAATFVNIGLLYMRFKGPVRFQGRQMAGLFGSRAMPGNAGKTRPTARRQPSGSGRAVHRCAICGRTQADNPDLEFRYCSKCEGGQEYCQDHLFTHVHVKAGERPHMQAPG